MGLSCGILGNGFGLSRDTLIAVPYEAGSVVEDLEYHLKLIGAGYTVKFADGTTVRADMPVGGRGAGTQRARWEGGRFQMLRRFVPELTLKVLKGNSKSVEPLLDLLLLPLALHVVLLLVTLAVPFTLTRMYAAISLAIVFSHVVIALIFGGASTKDATALFVAPFYIAWKLLLLPKVFLNARRKAEWVRTERAAFTNE